ncbi:hypothetical protein J1N35_005308 [Gossypium stocksii]|uniref:Gag/pol protein n=1 Tax=Gossypium stocksii TaxID=47602 RepID=A0A9D4AIV4_9ROSI|nr:hypothetical protein J1N35_005308 [Gossypium stocksii]
MVPSTLEVVRDMRIEEKIVWLKVHDEEKIEQCRSKTQRMLCDEKLFGPAPMYPPTTQVETRKRWEEYDKIARCYMLASVTSTLYKQPKSCKTAKVILDKLEDMFGGQATLAQQFAITSLANSQQKANILVKEHMITLMGYL